MTAQLAPAPVFRSWNNLGLPLVGGKLNTYVAGTTTPQATYTDSTMGTPNTNPVILNFRGEAFVWLDPTLTYKFVLTDAFNNLIWTEDNIPGGFTPSAIAANLIPIPTNTWTIGSPAFTWANAYFGPNGAAVFDPVSGNIGYYKRTTAEIAANITPTNFSYAPDGLDMVLRYGADPTGSNDSTAAFQNALLVCAKSGLPLRIPAGTYKIGADLTVPVGVVFLNSAPFAIDILGAGREQTIIQFTGGGITNGIYFNGVSNFKLCGKICDVTLDGATVAPTVLTFQNCDMPRAERCIFRRTTGRAVWFNTTIMGQLISCYITGAGSASQAAVEVLSSTTFRWDTSYCSGNNVDCVAGLRIDKSGQSVLIGGAIETSGIPIQIGSLADTTAGCVGGLIHGMDLELPNDHYLEFGYGCSGSAQIEDWDVRANSGFPSGAPVVTYAVKCNKCVSIRFGDNNWAQNGSPTATYWLEGATNLGVEIEPHRELFGNSFPWVMQNGAQITWATPVVHFSLADLIGNGKVPNLATLTGATASLQVNTQGGINRDFLVFNSGATTMTALSGGVRGMEINMISTNGNTTLTHSTSTANQWNLTLSGAANLVMVASKPYKFIHNGTNWYQVTN